MTFTANLEKTRKDLEKTLSDPTPLYVLAGATDFAVEKLRDLSTELSTRAAKLDAKALREQAQAAQAGVSSRVENLQGDLQAAPQQAKELPAKVQSALGDAAATALSTAVAAYGEFAERGETLVKRVRQQSESQQLDEQLGATTAKVKAATTTVKKSAKATKSSAKSTTTTAKKQAGKTRTATKSAATSAKKSATTAKDAATAASEKVGD
jgi:hypothetical protein